MSMCCYEKLDFGPSHLSKPHTICVLDKGHTQDHMGQWGHGAIKIVVSWPISLCKNPLYTGSVGLICDLPLNHLHEHHCLVENRSVVWAR